MEFLNLQPNKYLKRILFSLNPLFPKLRQTSLFFSLLNFHFSFSFGKKKGSSFILFQNTWFNNGSGEVIQITNGMVDVMVGKAMVDMVAITLYHSIRTQTFIPQLLLLLLQLMAHLEMRRIWPLPPLNWNSEPSKHQSLSYKYIYI